MNSLAHNSGQHNTPLASPGLPELRRVSAVSGGPVGDASPDPTVGGAPSLFKTTGNKSTDRRVKGPPNGSPEGLVAWREKKAAELRVKRRADQNALMASLNALGMEDEAKSVRRCGLLHGYKHSACGGVFYRSLAISCQNALCSYCLHERAARLAADWTPILSRFASPAKLMLSTRRYAGESLVDAGKRFAAGWGKFVRSVEFKAHVAGGVLSTEVAHSVGWGVHGHGLIDSAYWDVRAISALWEKCTGDSPVVWIERVKPGDAESLADAIAEIIKYPCKVADIVDRPELVGEYLEWVKGRHMFRSFGSCVGALGRYEAELAVVAEAELAARAVIAGVSADEQKATDLSEGIAVAKAEREVRLEIEDTCPLCGGRGDIVMVVGHYLNKWDCVPLNDVWWGPAPPDPGGG